MPDFENFPDDDEIALLQYIEEFTALYQEELGKYGENEDTRQVGIEFMNNVLSAARALEVQDFNGWRIPDLDAAYSTVNEFKLFTRSYVIRCQVKAARLVKTYSVSLDTATRNRVHSLITAIREVLDKADIEERKRNSLYDKLNAFAADVDRARTRFDNAMAFMIDAANAVKKSGEALSPLTELIKRINELLGNAKDLEGDTKLPPPVERKRIEGPKKSEPTLSRDMDDEIPF